MKHTKLLYLLISIVLVFSCSNGKEQVVEINMSDFSSTDILISGSYSDCVRRYGNPDNVTNAVFRNYQDESSYESDSCKLLHYKMGLFYYWGNDSVSIYSVNFNKLKSCQIKYKSHILDANFSIKNAMRCFNAEDSAFTFWDFYDAMCGLDSSGYELEIPIEGTFCTEYCDFYFGSEHRLKGIYFPPLQNVRHKSEAYGNKLSNRV